MRFGGSFAPGVLRLPGGGTRQGRAAPRPEAGPETETGPETAPETGPAVDAPPAEAAAAVATRAAPPAAVPAPPTGPAPAPPTGSATPPGGGNGSQVPLGTLLARAGRLLGALGGTGGSLLVGAFEVTGNGQGDPDERAAVEAAAGALRAELRFDDPMARVDARLLVIAAPLAPGASDGPATAAHLAAAVGRAVEAAAGPGSHPGRGGYAVRHAHVVAGPPFEEEVDQLVRRVVRDARAPDGPRARLAGHGASPPGG